MMLLSLPISGFAQKDTLIKKLDSLAVKKAAIGQTNNTNPNAYKGAAQLNFKTYFILLGSDLKQEFTKPFHMAKKDWRNFGEFAVVAVALSFADKPIQQAALKLRNRNTEINNVSKYVTNFGGTYEAYTLVGLGAYGLIFKDQKIKTTTLLATQAYITGAALESVLKYLTGRTRPSFYAPGVEAKPKFLGPFSKAIFQTNGSNSFPSGHPTVAFAAATVFASEYRDKPLIPIFAYSVATLIGVSRITENKHWSTDVLVGAAVGFLAGKEVVDNYHRYAKIEKNGKKKETYSFNLNYANGRLEPGLVVH